MSFAVHVSKDGRGAISAKLRGFHLSLTPVPMRGVCARVVRAKAARGAETTLSVSVQNPSALRVPSTSSPRTGPLPHESKGKCTVSMLLRILLKSVPSCLVESRSVGLYSHLPLRSCLRACL